MRGTVMLFVLFVAATLPASAFAVAPVNDTQSGALALSAPWQPGPASPLPIPPEAAGGGWVDATTSEDGQPGAPSAPSCFGSAGYYSLWYSVLVPESSVLTVTLSSDNPADYQPIITIVNTSACALGSAKVVTGGGVTASAYVTKGTYLVRIASAVDTSSSGDDVLPTLQLSARLRDVTPPQIVVSVSKVVGIDTRVTFNATGSTDGAGSGIDPATTTWTFYDAGKTSVVSGSTLANPEIATHSFRTPGLHRVMLQLADRGSNVSTYAFNVLTHSFVPPKVALRVLVPKVGSGLLRLVLTHDQSVRLRLVVLQGGTVLRTIPTKVINGKRPTTIAIALKHRIAKTVPVIVTGTASDLSANPNTVPLRTCSVRAGTPGSVVCA